MICKELKMLVKYRGQYLGLSQCKEEIAYKFHTRNYDTIGIVNGYLFFTKDGKTYCMYCTDEWFVDEYFKYIITPHRECIKYKIGDYIVITPNEICYAWCDNNLLIVAEVSLLRRPFGPTLDTFIFNGCNIERIKMVSNLVKMFANKPEALQSLVMLAKAQERAGLKELGGHIVDSILKGRTELSADALEKYLLESKDKITEIMLVGNCYERNTARYQMVQPKEDVYLKEELEALLKMYKVGDYGKEFRLVKVIAYKKLPTTLRITKTRNSIDGWMFLRLGWNKVIRFLGKCDWDFSYLTDEELAVWKWLMNELEKHAVKEEDVGS